MGTTIKSAQLDQEQNTGWKYALETWTYSSVSGLIGVITVPTGAASRYQKGDRIRFKQGGSYKYFVVTAVTDTTLSITGGSDYTLTNASITDNYYSHELNPIGYPSYFNYTSTPGGYSAAPTFAFKRFSVVGNRCNVEQYVTAGGTSNNATTTDAVPIPALSAQYIMGNGRGMNGGGYYSTQQLYILTAASATVTIKPNSDDASNFSGTGTKFAELVFSYIF